MFFTPPDHVALEISGTSSPNNKNNSLNVISESTPLMIGATSGSKSVASSISEDDASIRTLQALPGMKIRSHYIDKTANVKEATSSKEALHNARRNRGHYWIDIDADATRDAEELRDWLDQLKLPAFMLAQLAEPSRTWFSEVVTLRGCGLVVVRILPADIMNDDHLDTYIAALTMGRNLLITFTSCPNAETTGLYRDALRYMHERDRLPDASAPGAMLAWLRFHLERTSRSTRELSSHVHAMDEAMDREGIHAVKLEEIIDVKDTLLRLLSVAEEQHECLESLSGLSKGGNNSSPTDSSLDFQRLRGALSVLLSKTAATERAALRLEKHITELRNRHVGHQQEDLNRRLAVLTVLSAIFLPLTLITGIWGMNFSYMPELQSPEAYPIALMFMFGLAVTMFCFFWRTGWFND
eukprot:scaffold522_cov168-Amphora_coffeaeformis.AAC.17